MIDARRLGIAASPMAASVPTIADTPIFASYPTDTSDANVRAFVNTVRQVLSEMDYLKGG